MRTATPHKIKNQQRDEKEIGQAEEYERSAGFDETNRQTRDRRRQESDGRDQHQSLMNVYALAKIERRANQYSKHQEITQRYCEK